VTEVEVTAAVMVESAKAAVMAVEAMVEATAVAAKAVERGKVERAEAAMVAATAVVARAVERVVGAREAAVTG